MMAMVTLGKGERGKKKGERLDYDLENSFFQGGGDRLYCHDSTCSAQVSVYRIAIGTRT